MRQTEKPGGADFAKAVTNEARAGKILAADEACPEKFIRVAIYMKSNAFRYVAKAARAAVSIAAIMFALEAVSALGIYVNLKRQKLSSPLFSRFPAQLRIGREELTALVLGNGTADLLEKGNYDPAMGFRDTSKVFLTGDRGGDFLICAIGGSTTAGQNWPVYLSDAAKKFNARERVEVLNAGIPGYMSFNQHLFLSNFILGKDGRKCGVVLSLDGVNDVHFRVAAYTQSLKNGDEWIPGYHGYQQKLENDMRSLATPAGAFRQFAGNFARDYAVGAAVRLMPYTMRILSNALKKAGGGAHAKEPPPPRAMLEAMPPNKAGELTLPDRVEDEIVRAYRGSLLDLAGSCSKRRIPFVDYLQPVHLRRYYPNKFPAVNSANRVPRTIGHQLGYDCSIDAGPVYAKTEMMYESLMKEYPENFGNLIYLFKNSGGTDMYVDSVHYSKAGNRAVAEAIIKDLLRRGILHAKR